MFIVDIIFLHEFMIRSLTLCLPVYKYIVHRNRAKTQDRVVQDCEHEGPHYGLRKNLWAAKKGTPLQLKGSFAVLTDLTFAARLTEFLILG